MKNSIEQKIIPAIVIAISLILAGFGTYSYLTSKTRYLEAEHRNMEAAVSRLSTALASPLWDLNDKAAEEFVVAEMIAPEIAAVIVRDAKGEVFTAKGRGDDGQPAALAGPAGDGLERLARDVVKDGEKIGAVELHYSDEAVLRDLRSLLLTTLIQVILIDIAIVAMMVVLIRRVVTRPLGRAVERLEEISQGDGDLTVSLPEEGAREIALLAHSFNTFVRKTRAVIDEVKALNAEMVAAAAQLSSATRGIAASNDSVADQSKALAAAAEEMGVTVTQVERDSAAVHQVSENAQKTASNGVRVISQSVNAMQDVSDVVQRAVTTVQGLGEESKKIRSVVDMIENIANQTNLLALNAAIEAARAGEYGRGFAVVADEVRKLAQNTVNATTEVSRTVASIQNESVRAVDVMKQGQHAVGEVVELAQQAGAAIREIDSTVAVATGQIQQIAGATRELAATIRDMTRNVDVIAGAVEQNSRTTAEISQTADAVASKADHLHRVTGSFKT